MMPDQKSVLVGDGSGYIGVWELGLARESRALVRDTGDDCVWHISPNLRWLAYAREHGADAWDLSTNQKIRSIETKYFPGNLAISPDGKWMVVTSQGGGQPVLVIDVKTGMQKSSFEGSENGSTDIAMHPTANLLAINRQGTVVLRDLDFGRETKRVVVEQGGGTMAFSADGRWLAVAAQWTKTAVQLIDVASGVVSRVLTGTEKETSVPEIKLLRFSPNGAYLYVGYNRILEDTSGVHIYDVASGKLLGGLPQEAVSIEFSRDGRTVLLVNVSGALQLYSMKP